MLPQHPQHPQTLGDIVGLSIRVVRNNLRLIIEALLLPSIFCCASVSLTRLLIAHWLKIPMENSPSMWLHGAGLFFLYLTFAFSERYLTLAGLAVMRFCLGHSSSYKEGFAIINKRKNPLTAITCAVGFLPLIVLLIFVMIAGWIFEFHRFSSIHLLFRLVIVFVFVSSFSIASLWSFLIGSIWLAVFACEDISLMKVGERGLYLSAVAFWRGLAFICLMMLAVWVLSTGLNVPLMVVTVLDHTFYCFPKSANLITAELPVYFELLIVLWGGILTMLLLALVLIADGLYYQDLRVRLEGIDIKARLAQMI